MSVRDGRSAGRPRLARAEFTDATIVSTGPRAAAVGGLGRANRLSASAQTKVDRLGVTGAVLSFSAYGVS